MKFSLSVVIACTVLPNVFGESSTLLRGGTIEKDEDADDTRRVVSIPLIPHRHHPRASSIDHSDDESEHRYHRSLEKSQDNARQDREADDEDIWYPEADELYQGYGTHYVDLWVGTPPQRQTVIVDTGSSVTAFPCSGCRGCGSGYHTDEYFNEHDSSTFEVVGCKKCLLGKPQCSYNVDNCKMSVAYQEGSSWHAFESKDVVYTGGPHDKARRDADASFHLRFGCQTDLSGLFKTQLADGIMGMEMEAGSYWLQMHESGALPDKQFSLCFSRQPTAEREGTGAGAMTLGGVDSRLHETPMLYARQFHSRGWYVVRVQQIFLRTNGGERAVPVLKGDREAGEQAPIMKKVDISTRDINNGDIIVDSGTTDTYLGTKLARPFNNAWREMTGQDYSNSNRQYSDEELSALPTILFQLSAASNHPNPEGTPGLVGALLDPNHPDDIMVAMPPSHYMEYSAKAEKYTSRLYFNERHGGVLGANFMMGHDVHFDMENGRVGFAESSCDYETVHQ